jgi:HNH endonuclease
MLNMMAVVARPYFEADNADCTEGSVVRWRTYRADHSPLKRLRTDRKNRLYLVTVRPPRNVVWLVAVYENVAKKGGEWTSAIPNRTPIVDLTPVLGGLKFESGKGLKVPTAKRPQALQAPRVLTAADVALIHGELRRKNFAVPPDPGDWADLDNGVSSMEGRKVLKVHFARERSPRLRAAAREYWRARQHGSLRCLACGFSFRDVYGDAGESFIELHHTRALGASSKAHRNTPQDLIPVCSNCHRMIHRNISAPMPLAKLQKIIHAQ